MKKIIISALLIASAFGLQSCGGRVYHYDVLTKNGIRYNFNDRAIDADTAEFAGHKAGDTVSVYFINDNGKFVTYQEIITSIEN